MSLSDAQVLEAVSSLIDDNTGKPFVAAKAVKNIKISDAELSLDVVLAYPANSQHEPVRLRFEAALAPLAEQRKLSVRVGSLITSHSAQRGVPLLSGVKNVIAVASGKGGVGKSTTAANLALALSAEGARVGILDADIYGPSQPLMMGLQGQRPETPDGKSLKPLESHGVQTMSIGYLVDADQAMVWRGPMVSQALQQLLNDTRWDNLDYLVIDMPPGTGDIQLTLSQKVPVTGAVIVTTPQDIALLDARKGVTMFQKVGIPILGMVENMAIHVCSNCGHAEHIFGEGGAARMAADFGVDVLGSLPLDMGIRLAADGGTPTVAADPDGKVAELYKAIARKVAVKVGEKAQDFSGKFPKIVIQNN
ncbi:ATP-binding protein involved in chromosome partitioning [Chromobacterium alkanivorans]|uniref:iron-sulfur cluster carrier protein ApbC n=1 Tax=Chromobacterium TaxID=535 RepID=UPI000652BE0B|nr:MULTISPECIES: iron-sulfur cluster carrier protein ApbC [Chromobacterium]KMN83481.1 ATP-binding protein [Chromobacterium sp. LK11]MCS3806073.1 ATP-binding protein involved in chromosome partitioning [Chromobacterium alkanivorans]MCS3820525.1 ATP-binding protein involved in chromosome partitioning [Chromobacterium alkanivorans]MCS3875283.1 ATP-binding protein involved in chromosome partitioning [Chromobacterium alkanivorans]